jgi:hypothetical protein
MAASVVLENSVGARRIDAHGSPATMKQPSITLDTDVSGSVDAFNPAELFLAVIAAACLMASSGMR